MKNHLYNNSRKKLLRKSLRRSMTPQEIMVWRQLKGRRLGFKFRRQYSVGPYILDFFCVEKQLAIEIDGSQHQSQQSYDKDRTVFLSEQNIRVIRFWNNEVNLDLDEVVGRIYEIVRNTPQSHKLDSPPIIGGANKKQMTRFLFFRKKFHGKRKAQG